MNRWPRESPHRTPAHVTTAGAAWLASASPFPRSVRALWAECPGTSVVLPCGTVFDVISAPGVFGRRMVSRLWADGPGTGPVATQRGRVLMFAAPGTAQRLPALLRWEEWGSAAPPLLCHGTGDAVTVPPPDAVRPEPRSRRPEAAPGESPALPAAPGLGLGAAPDPLDAGSEAAPGSRWLVAPDVRDPWLPGADVLLWACVRAARSGSATAPHTAVTRETALSPR